MSFYTIVNFSVKQQYFVLVSLYGFSGKLFIVNFDA